MKKLFLLALLPSLAWGQVLSRPSSVSPAGVSTQPITAPAYSISSACSTAIADDANTVAHVKFTANGIVDTKGNSWTMVGSVPQIQGTGFVPAGAGPFSGSAAPAKSYYSLGTGTDVLDFAGDFTAAFIINNPDTTNTQILATDYTTDGWVISLGTNITFSTWGSSAYTSLTVPAQPGLATIVFGRSGTTQFLASNGYVRSTTGAKTGVDSVSPAILGVHGNLSSFPFVGTIREAWFSTTTPTAASIAAIDLATHRCLQSIRLSALGDSNTVNYAAIMPPLMSNTVHVEQDGVNGETIAQIAARWTSTIRARRPDVLVVMAGTNDCHPTVHTPGATAWATLQTMLNEAVSDGITVIPMTIPPFTGSGYYEDTRSYVNTALKAWGVSNNIRVFDTDALGDGASPPALAGTYDSGDHIHINTAGNTILVGYLNNAIATRYRIGDRPGIVIGTGNGLSLGGPTGQTLSLALAEGAVQGAVSYTTQGFLGLKKFSNGIQLVADSLGTCGATVIGRMMTISVAASTARTKTCYCTSDNAASPAYAWKNITDYFADQASSIGDTTTCP